MASNIIPATSGETGAPALTGHDLLKRAESIAVHWWSIIGSVLESAQYDKGGEQPLPQWAIDRLQDDGALNSTYDEHRKQHEMAHQALNLAEGKGHDYTYEIRTSRVGHRLDISHVSMESARKALTKAKKKYPDAFIARVHVRRPSFLYSDEKLLDTLIGQIRWAGGSCGRGDEEEHHTVQDSTGRTVTVPLSILVAHKSVMSRLSNEARGRIEFDLRRAEKRLATRAGEQETAHV